MTPQRAPDTPRPAAAPRAAGGGDLGLLLLTGALTAMVALVRGVGAAARVEPPEGKLTPMITLLSIVGACSITSNVADVWRMLGLGAGGCFMKQYGYEIGLSSSA